MKRPFDEILETYSENISTVEQQDKEAHAFLDSFVIWLIGFSIGAIALIISDFASIKPLFSYLVIKSIAVLFALSIISGVFHRIFLFYFKREYNGQMFYIKGALSNKKVMETSLVDVADIPDANTLVTMLMVDYQLDYSEDLKLYNKLTEAEKEKHLEFLRAKYRETNEWAVKDFKLGLEYVENTIKTGLQLSDKEYFKQSALAGSNIKRYRILQFYSLCGCGIFFILAILLFVISF